MPLQRGLQSPFMQLLNRVIFQDQSADMLSRRETLDFLVWEEEEEKEEKKNTLPCEFRRLRGLHCQSVLAKQYITLSLFLRALSLKYINVSRLPPRGFRRAEWMFSDTDDA